nr:dihydrodipicolinate synthase family protein [Auraticoccus cholistanensis]
MAPPLHLAQDRAEEQTVADGPEVLAALITPFAGDRVGTTALRALLERLEPHLDGVFLPGTMGEFLALGASEADELWRIAAEVLGPGRVVAHVGAAAVGAAAELVAVAAGHGVTRFAAITPFYLRVGRDDVLRHYARLVERVPEGTELYGYVFPDVTGNDLLPADLPALAATGVVGVKVSGRAAERVEEYLAAAPEGFALWSGKDSDLPRVLRAGGRGTVSGTCVVHPRLWADLRDGWAAGDETRWTAAQRDIERLVPVVGASIARVRHALELVGTPVGPARMPQPSLDDADRAQVRDLLADLGLLAGAGR